MTERITRAPKTPANTFFHFSIFSEKDRARLFKCLHFGQILVHYILQAVCSAQQCATTIQPDHTYSIKATIAVANSP